MTSFELIEDFEVECCGEEEIWVYDIEVEEHHNFFANDILVHNSNYINFADFMNIIRSNKGEISNNDTVKIINNFMIKTLDPIIEEEFNNVAKRMNYRENRIWMSRECISKAGIWTGKGKYCLYVLDKEGVTYKEPQLKVTGLQTVSKATPASVKPFLRSVLTKILEKEDISQYIKECRKKYDTFTAEQVAFPRGANNFEKWYQEKGIKKGTPIAVKASFIFNRYIDLKNLESQYTKIKSGDKIKYTYLRQPNLTESSVIGFLRRLPEELHKYVDFDMMYYKSFMSVVESICDKIGIEYEEKKVDLNNLF